MTNPDDPAFNPIPGSGSPGLTKREYFAAMAMQGILTNTALLKELDGKSIQVKVTTEFGVSQVAIRFADALIAELNK